MAKDKRNRTPRLPATSILPATFVEAEIIAAMADWPSRQDAALRLYGLADGLNDREAGHRLWQAKYEHALAFSTDPDVLLTIIWLAEQGHIAAQRTLRDYITKLLENGKVDLPSSVRAYLGRMLNGLIPAHPGDQSEVIDQLFRNMGVVAMVDSAALRWSLPKLNSSQRQRSAAYFVGVIMELSEKQVRTIYQHHRKLASRMARFLTGHNL